MPHEHYYVHATRHLCYSPQTINWSLDVLTRFLEDYARWNPSQEPVDSRTELMKTIMHYCRKHTVRHEIAAGPKTDQAVNAVWAAMVYHTPALTNALMTYGKEKSVDMQASIFSSASYVD